VRRGYSHLSSVGGPQSPHIELHMRNVSVRDVLDAISLKSIEVTPLYDSRGESGAVHTGLPNGWKAELPPGDISKAARLQRVLTAC
jgi:hypothetical protein